MRKLLLLSLLASMLFSGAFAVEKNKDQSREPAKRGQSKKGGNVRSSDKRKSPKNDQKDKKGPRRVKADTEKKDDVRQEKQAKKEEFKKKAEAFKEKLAELKNTAAEIKDEKVKAVLTGLIEYLQEKSEMRKGFFGRFKRDKDDDKKRSDDQAAVRHEKGRIKKNK